MCVIMVCNDTRPTEEMIERAYRANDDGAGGAFRGDDGLVHWNKGLDLEQIKAFFAEKPLPLVGHFRRESCGGKLASLTHPFPIDVKASNFINGHTGGEGLFHNGHWGKWKETLFEVCVRFGKKIPDGKFSDTRAMAFIGGIVGKNFFDLIDEKVVIFGPKTLEMTNSGSGWTTINGVLCSNGAFMHIGTGNVYNHSDFRTNPACKGDRCYIRINLDSDGYCAGCARKRAAEASSTADDDKTTPVVGAPYPFPKPTSGNRGTTPVMDPTQGGTAPKLLGPKDGGGASSVETPFASLRAAEELYSQGKISHTFIKKMRKWFADLPPIQQTMTPMAPAGAATIPLPEVEIIH